MPAPRRIHRIRGVASTLMLLVPLAACTNTEAPNAKNPHTGTATATTVDGVQQITVLTGSDLRFHPSTLIVHPGRVRILLKNRADGGSGGPPHNLEVSGLPGAFVPLTSTGQTGTVTFTASAPGRYGFVCTIHEEQGQNGTLIVEPGTGSGGS